MTTKPEYDPVFCPVCFHAGEFRKLRTATSTLILICDVHGRVLTLQYFDAIISGMVA